MIRKLFVLGFILIALGGWLYYDSLPQQQCTFNIEELEVNDIPPESEREITFTFTNPTNEMVRIVGLADC